MTPRVVVTRIGVVTVLIVLALLVFEARSIQPPAMIQQSIGLGAFELAVIASAGGMILATLLLASRFGVVWPSFLHPSICRSSALASLRFGALAFGFGSIFFVGFAVVSISYGSSNTREPPAMMTLDESLPSIMALVTVVVAVALARAVILFGIEHRSGGELRKVGGNKIRE